MHRLEDTLNDLDERLLPKVNKAVKDHQGLLVRDHVREETEEGVRQEGFQHDISRLKVNIQVAFSGEEPIFDIPDKCGQFFHAVCVKEAPLVMDYRSTATCLHFLGYASTDALSFLLALHDVLQDRKGYDFVLHSGVNHSRDKVHTLSVPEFLVMHREGAQNIEDRIFSRLNL